MKENNNQKLREALKYLRDASREFHHLILNSKHNEICDKYKYAAAAKISDAIANAGLVLSAPLRNCDLFANEDEACKAFIDWYNTVYDLSDDKLNKVSMCKLLHNVDDILLTYITWLFAEAEGEAK